jgi:hypothetical protein
MSRLCRTASVILGSEYRICVPYLKESGLHGKQGGTAVIDSRP